MKSRVESRESRARHCSEIYFLGASAPWRFKQVFINTLALTLLLSGGAAIAQDEPLGRLFYTPAERSSMDLERLTGVAGAGGGAAVKLNGIVRNRASGSSTVWLNGAPWHGADRLTGVSPSRADPARARVTTASGNPVEVRVGQITDRASGINIAPLANDSIVIHRKSGHEAKP